MPLPWMQANSPPDRLTPSSRYVAPAAVTILLPETCSAGALPFGGGLVGGGLVGGGLVGGGVVGGGVVTAPVQVTPLSMNDAGFGLLPVHEALKPIWALRPVPRAAFQDMFVAVTTPPDWDQLALQPCVMACVPGKLNLNVQPLMGSPRLVTTRFAVKPPWPGLVVQSLVV